MKSTVDFTKYSDDELVKAYDQINFDRFKENYIECLNEINFRIEQGIWTKDKMALRFRHTGMSFSAANSNFDNNQLILINEKKIRVLILSGTIIDDRGIKYIADNFPLLEVLCLDDTLITDKGLDFLKSLSNLRELWIENTRVTDNGLNSLIMLSKLEYVSAIDTQLTEEGVKQFFAKNQLSNLLISFSNAHD